MDFQNQSRERKARRRTDLFINGKRDEISEQGLLTLVTPREGRKVKLPENEIFKVAALDLKSKGWRVVSEVDVFGRPIDGAAIKGDLLLAIESKMSLSKKLVSQLATAQLVADKVLGVIGRKPKKHFDWCKSAGMAIWLVQDGRIEVLSEWGENPHTNSIYREKLKQVALTQSEDLNGGTPCLKGVGPAQDIQRGVDEYLKTHPNAKWKEIFENVPNYYSTYKNMYSALRSGKERRHNREVMKKAGYVVRGNSWVKKS